ncbi:hypothetical protein M3Y94_00365400 [Aphelenchoides besseyi]|nr:hypothetical protein M3Y94_00365400 [Aphelenchoides besseyi]
MPVHFVNLMQALRKLVNKPRIDDWSPLAKFFYADETLNAIANELDSFDGRRDPERCNQLVSKLRQAQDRVLHIIAEMLTIVFPSEAERACRDYRAKFPDEIIHDNLPGQLWFGAECLAAGSNIVDHEAESEAIRPMARALTRHLDKMRNILKDQALRDPTYYSPKIKANLRVFDNLFAEFEFNYVSAMVPVKTSLEYDHQLNVAVLFSESLIRAIEMGYVTREQIDDSDPTLMIALPRIAIVWGLTVFQGDALNLNLGREHISEMFRHFYDLLLLIRSLLLIIEDGQRAKLERYLITGMPDGKDMVHSTNVSDLLATCSEVVTSKGVAVECVDGQMQNVETLQTGETVVGSIIYNDDNSLQSLVLNDDFKQQAKKNIQDVIHRLFVCICGVADQLQTNYSSDIRKILKMVLQPVEVSPVFEVSGKTASTAQNVEETGVEVQENISLPTITGVEWVPDSDCENCVACGSSFTFIRRRHHCRNCGRIFCYRCSANALSIPELGYDRPVRVCNVCYLFKSNPFSPCTPNGIQVSSPSETSDDSLRRGSMNSVSSDILPSTSAVAMEQ